MITKNNKTIDQIQMVSIEQLVPQDHILRKIDAAIDFDFIYDLVEERYCPDNGRPSIDPVVLIKIAVIQYMFGIKSMRQTIKEIEVNIAYRWFLGLDFYDKILVAKKNARFYDDILREEINADLAAHGKNPLKDKCFSEQELSDDNNDDTPGSGATPSRSSSDVKEKKVSTTDPESGWFHKGEHKEVFAYAVEAACDKNGWILDYTVHPGNEHDSKTFPHLYEKLKKLNPKYIIADAGYKTPAIAKMLIDDGITPVMPYTAPKTKDGFFKKYEYVYDEYNDTYICPGNQMLKYSTTNRDGYREYKSNGQICMNCPYLNQCTLSKTHQKVITRHIWQDYMEICEDIRHTTGMKDMYAHRKETIERCFGTAKEHHGMRYTQQIGNEKMRMKVGMTFACLNMKKLARLLWKKENYDNIFRNMLKYLLKTQFAYA